MKWRISTPCLSAAVLMLPLALPSCITTVRVANGLSSPVFATAAPGDSSRLFIVERGGRVKFLNLNTNSVSTLLDITSLVKSGGEQGLLGLAFHPNFSSNRRFFVSFTSSDGALNVWEFLVSADNPNLADDTTGRLVLRVPQPQENHNGGWLGFGPDGFLYIGTGDGGGGNDDDAGHTPGIGNAQDITDNLLGKILRVIPDAGEDAFPGDSDRNYGIPEDNPFVGITGDDEIWAYGLRNPWRCSFDRQTFDFWIGDVGQDAREEVNFAPASSSGGENYGWRLREGTIATPGVGGPQPPGNVDPLYDYLHGAGAFQGNSVTGGYVYRGSIPELRGKYFFADFVRQKVWSFTRTGNTFTDLTDWTSDFRPDAGSINGVSSFGEDASGELYIVDLDGELFRITKTSGLRVTATTTLNRLFRFGK